MQAHVWGAGLRLAQAILEGAPTLLVGFVVAGVLRRLLGAAMTRQVFGSSTWRAIPQAWAIGMLLPVCSLGVIPIAYEMRRCRVPGASILAFALTAPLFNPLSLLYGLTLAEPLVILLFASLSLLIVTFIGLGLRNWFEDSQPADRETPTVAPGARRMVAVASTAAETAAGTTAIYVAIGLLGTALLGLLLPKGTLSNVFGPDDPTAPVTMAALALPAFATPLSVMMQLGSMFVHGNSIGAAYALLALGTGMNLGLAAWSLHHYGARNTAMFLLVFVTTVLAIAYTLHAVMQVTRQVDHHHTHAFDSYCCPFASGEQNLGIRFGQMLSDSAQAYQLVSLAILALLAILGGVLRATALGRHLEQYLLAQPPDAQQPRYDLILPNWVLAAVAIGGLVMASVVGCFVYFPAPADTLAEMRITRADALSAASARNVPEALRQLERYDDLTRRLQVGFFLRHRELDAYRRAKARVLRARLEHLKDLVEAGQFEDLRPALRRVHEAHTRCVAAFS